MTPPDAETLRRFLNGELPPDELEAVARYLDDHPQLASTLNARHSGDTLLAVLRSATPAPADPPELARLIDQLSRLPAAMHSADTTHTATPELPDDELGTVTSPGDFAPVDDGLDLAALLAPPREPDELGRLDGFRVLGVLGRGGMGVVFEAEDIRLGRRVALKVMLPHVAANPESKRRFTREAEAAARVEHDYIVPILQLGEDRGVPFVAMPLLAGESLANQLKGGRALAVSDVLAIGRQIAEGLAAAHDKGLIHRDIKPSNVWLERTADGAFRRVRILDFGLAKPVASAGELTHTGAILGTPAYMAPEQARGLPVDHRADLFSLGSVLYQMATGRRPFQGADAYSVLTALATETPPAADAVNPAVPAPLADLIARLMTKDVARRSPTSARAVADELARLAAGRVPTASATQITAPAPAKPADVWAAVADAATVADDSPAAPAHRKPRRALRIALAAAVLLPLIVLAAYGKTVVRIVTDQGELVVEVDDPSIEVVVKQGGAVIRDKTKDREFVIRAGANGEVEFYDPATGAKALTKAFTLTRGDTTRVKATMAAVVAARPKPPAGGDSGPQRPPAGDAPPAKDAFPGTVAYADTFDNATLSKLPTLNEPAIKTRFEGGLYRCEYPAGERPWGYVSTFGPNPQSVAFIVRARAANVGLVFHFRPLADDKQFSSLEFAVNPDGTWELRRVGITKRPGMGGEPATTVLQTAVAAEPDLTAGRWFILAVRSVGPDTTVWVNGRELARATEAGPPPALPRQNRGFAVRPEFANDQAAGYDLDYLTIWELPAPGPAPLADAPRKALEWVLDNGGSVKVVFAGQPRVLVKGQPLPAGPVEVASVSLVEVKGFDDAAVANLRDLPPLTEGIGLNADTGITAAGVGRLAAIPGVKGIAQFGIEGDAVTGDWLPALAAFPDLAAVMLTHTKVAGPLLSQLALPPLLHAIDLSNTPIADADLTHLTACKNLQVLHLHKTAVTKAGVEAFAAARPDVQIEWDGERVIPKEPYRVNLDDQQNALRAVCRLGGWVHMRNADYHDADQVPAGPYLRDRIAVHLQNVKAFPAAELDALAGLPVTVAEVNLQGSAGCTDAVFARIAAAPGLRFLYILILTGTPVTDAGLVHLKPFRHLLNLRLEGAQVAGPGLAHLRGLPRLASLGLGGPSLTNADLGHLKGLNLGQLGLVECRVADDVFAAVAGMSSLRTLDVLATPVTDAGVAKLKGLTDLMNVTFQFKEPNPAFTDASLPVIAGWRDLATLTLTNAAVTDDGFGKLKGMPKLRVVKLSDLPKLTDDGLAHLAGCPALESVSLTRVKATKAGAEALVAARPACKVLLDGVMVGGKK